MQVDRCAADGMSLCRPVRGKMGRGPSDGSGTLLGFHSRQQSNVSRSPYRGDGYIAVANRPGIELMALEAAVVLVAVVGAAVPRAISRKRRDLIRDNFYRAANIFLSRNILGSSFIRCTANNP